VGPAVDRYRSSVLHLPGLRSEYAWLPPDGSPSVSKPGHIGVSFSAHRRLVLERAGRARTLDVAAGSTFATGSDTITWSDVREPAESLEMYLDGDLLRAATAAVAAASPPPVVEPVTGAHDPVVLGVAAALKRAHVHDRAPDDVAAGTLAHRLAEHVAATYCGLAGVRRPPVGCLDDATVRRVSALVEDRIEEPTGGRLTVGDLAAVAGLSPFHFARSFAATVGMAPHAFVTMRRMERAKSLLLVSNRSVEAIAHDLGYTNVSHFRRSFRRHTGFTPSDLRAR
jgi:AraC family transcriptional regulator